VASRAVQGLGNQQDRAQQRESAHHGDHHEHLAPLPEHHDRTAQQRGDDRGDPAHALHDVHDPEQLRSLGQVDHDRASQYHAEPAAESLQDAQDQQQLDALGHRTADRGEQTQRQAEHHRPSPPHPVRERTGDHLAGRGPEEEGRQRQLHASSRGAQGVGHLGEGRDVHVGRQRADGTDGGQHRDHERRHRTPGACGIGRTNLGIGRVLEDRDPAGDGRDPGRHRGQGPGEGGQTGGHGGDGARHRGNGSGRGRLGGHDGRHGIPLGNEEVGNETCGPGRSPEGSHAMVVGSLAHSAAAASSVSQLQSRVVPATLASTGSPISRMG
jgi:hypothetical protein